MSDWDGKSERRKDMLDVLIEIKSISLKYEGQHKILRSLEEKIEKLTLVILGDGDKPGISGSLRSMQTTLSEHTKSDEYKDKIFMWVLIFIASAQGLALYKMFTKA